MYRINISATCVGETLNLGQRRLCGSYLRNPSTFNIVKEKFQIEPSKCLKNGYELVV